MPRSAEPPEVERAVVLRTVDHGEADRVVALFGRARGPFSVLARGARRSRRRFVGALEAFAEIEVRTRVGRGSLATLEEATPTVVFIGLTGSLDAMVQAGAATALVRELVAEGQSEPEVYDALLATYAAIDAAEAAPAVVTLAFVARVLALLGHAPELDVCAVTGRRAEDGRAVLFDPVRGAIVSRAAGGGPVRLGARARGFLRAAVRGERPASVLAASGAELSEIAACLEALIGAQWGRRWRWPPPQS